MFQFLLIVSATATALGHITFGMYAMLKIWNYDVEEYSWIPLACFSFIVFVGSFGINALPFIIVAEVMPLNIKEFGLSFGMVTIVSFQFITIKFFPILKESIAFHGSLFLFAFVCVLGVVFVIFFMPETKGKNHEEIMNLLK